MCVQLSLSSCITNYGTNLQSLNLLHTAAIAFVMMPVAVAQSMLISYKLALWSALKTRFLFFIMCESVIHICDGWWDGNKLTLLHFCLEGDVN